MGTTNPAATIEESSKPSPPRYWWTKRIALLGVAIVVGLLILRLWWGHYARAKLQAEIDAIHARGEPIFVEDFQTPSLPDNENAAWYLNKAAGVYVQPTPAQDNAVWKLEELPTPQDLALLQQFVDANQAALALVRQACGHERADWGGQFVPWQQRHLINLLANDASVLHANHDDAGAIEAIHDQLRMARAMAQGPHGLIQHLTAVIGDSIASQNAVQIAPGLAVNSAESSPASGSAGQVQVKALIRGLLDEQVAQASLRRAILAERFWAYNNRAQLLKSNGVNDWMIDLFRPAYDLGTVRTMQYCDATLAAAAEPNYQTASARMPVRVGDRSFLKMVSWIAQFRDIPSYDRVIELQYQIQTDHRAAATVLAIRLWQSDHRGQLPADLSALVPDYLPQIPLDPFSPQNAPFRYLPHTASGPILYSVGEDGIDDGGSEQPVDSRNFLPGYRWGRRDIVYHLQPTAPSTQPTTSP